MRSKKNFSLLLGIEFLLPDCHVQADSVAPSSLGSCQGVTMISLPIGKSPPKQCHKKPRLGKTNTMFHHDDDKQEGDVEEAHVEEDITKDYHVCACHKQQLKFLSLVGAILVLAVVVASICLSGHCSSSSSNAASSRDSGATAPTSVQNVTVPMAPSSAMLPTNAPIPSPTVITPSPVAPGDASPLFTSPPTRAPTQLPMLAQSPTLQSIRDAGVLPCGYYDVTLSDDGASGFSIELVCVFLSSYVCKDCSSSLRILFFSQCKALAAAIFQTTNVTNRYTAIPVTTLDRFTTLQDGNVDVLVGFTTHTMERQVLEVRKCICLWTSSHLSIRSPPFSSR